MRHAFPQEASVQIDRSRVRFGAGLGLTRTSNSLGLGRRAGSILVGLLWCVALLSILVIGLLHSATLDLRVVKNHGDVIQAQYLALAGVEKAKALLYHDAVSRRRSRQNYTGSLADVPEQFREIQFGRGRFTVFRQGTRPEGGGIFYGISDEESRLNVNHAAAEELGKLYEMTPEIVAAIIDYRDDDNAVTAGGAEAEYYMGLAPPRLPRNGPFQTVRELLMVRGVTPERLLGEDRNQNGWLDPQEDDGSLTVPVDNRDGILDGGWSAALTVNSSVRNVSAGGQERVNVQSADENTLQTVRGISAEIARAIVAYRGQNRLENLADLLEVRAMTQPNQPQPQPQPAPPPAPGQVGSSPGGPSGPGPGPGPGRGLPVQQGNAAPQPTGPALVSDDLLMEIGDEVTVSEDAAQAGAINVNSAGVEVLGCLPGADRGLAQAIVSHRQSSGFFPNIAWLLRVPGMTRATFKQIAPKVSARSETFRILSEGEIPGTGARKRLEVIVQLGISQVKTLSYREDL